MLMNVPAVISIGSSPSIRSRAAPASTTTHSASSWSYQNPSGDACPRDSTRSIRTPGVASSVRNSSSGSSAGMSFSKLPVGSGGDDMISLHLPQHERQQEQQKHDRR